MKRARYSEIFDDLAEHLEEIIKKAKENDRCHLIEPLEEIILKVKELNKGREVECEITGECNSESCDLQMACSCSDWGPDILGPDGKWICELCGNNCFCDQLWGSCTHLYQNEKAKNSFEEANKKLDTPEINEKHRKLFQKDSSVKCDPCVCGVSRKTENQNKTNKKNKPLNASAAPKIVSESTKKVKKEKKLDKPSQKDISVLCEPRFCSSIKKGENPDKILEKSSQTGEREKSEAKLSSKEIGTRILKKEANGEKKSKCKSCKCTYDEKGNKMKSEECRVALERKKKLIASFEKEKNAKVEDENREVQVKISHSTGNFNRYGKDTSANVLVFVKKGKCGIVECKSSSMGLLTSWKDSKDQRCRDGTKTAKNEERRAQQISKCVEKRSQNFPDKHASSRSDWSLQKSCSKLSPDRGKLEKPEKPLKCSEITEHGKVQKCAELIEKLERRESACKCEKISTHKFSAGTVEPKTVNRKGQPCNDNVEKSSKYSVISEHKRDQKRDGHPGQYSTRVRRQKIKTEKYFPGEDRQKAMAKMTEEKTPNRNFGQNPCNYCNPATSAENLCSCGCGYFLEGVPANSPCPCNNSLKNPYQEEDTGSKKSVTKSRKHDCEGCCEWCNRL